jgi:hypothetical protein
MTRSRTSLAVALFAFSAVLIGLAWSFVHASHCAGDLKQGFGDVEAALGLEGQGFLAFLAGAMFFAFGASVAKPVSSKWAQLAAWVAFIPLTYAAFLGLGFAAGGAWPCAH